MNRLWTAVWCAAAVCLSACNCTPPTPAEDGGTGGGGGGSATGGGTATGGGGGATTGGGGGGATGGGGGGATGGGGGGATGGGGGGATGGGGGGTTGGGGGDVDAGLPELLVEPQSLTLAVTEGGQASMAVRLTQAPGAPVTVTIVSSDALAAGASPTTLTFTAADWNIAQQVTVSGVEDQNLVPASADLTLSAPGMMPVVMAVNVTDDDTQSVVLAPGSTVQVNENGSATVTVALAFEPASTFTLAVTTGDPAVASVTPASLSFSPANYLTPQTLTVNGTDDGDAADGTTTLVVSGAGLTPATLTVEVNDDDALGIAFSVMSTTIPENGGGFVPVRLTAQPPAPVTVSFVSSDPGSLTVTTPTLQFTPQNWNTPQNLVLGGVTDDDVADENGVVTASAPALADRTLQVTVDDPDVVSVIVSPALNVTESASSPLAVRLSHRPASSVTVTLVADDPTRLLLVPPSFTFTPVNALIDQSVTVNALPDDDTDPEQLSITTTLAGVDKVTIVNVTDDDTQALFVPQTTLTVTEGNTTTLAVRLAYRPPGNVVVTVQSLDVTRVSVTTTSLTFTPANYATSQNAVLGGTQDTNLVNESATVRVSSTGLPSVDVTVNVTDDDTQAIVPSVSTVTVNEGSTQLVGVRLAFQPPSSVTVTGSIPGAADAHVVNTGGVTFTPSSWNTPQNLEVAVDRDLDRITAPTILTLTSSVTPQVFVPVTPVERTLALGFTTVAPSSTTLADGTVYAYPVTVPAGEYVFGYGVIAAVGGGQLQLALYTDAGGVPGNLVSLTALLSPMPVTFAGTNEREFTLGNSLAGGTYWIAYRGASNVQLRSGGTPLVSRCVRAAGIPDINAPWPATFGSTTCASLGPTNIYAITWH